TCTRALSLFRYGSGTRARRYETRRARVHRHLLRTYLHVPRARVRGSMMRPSRAGGGGDATRGSSGAALLRDVAPSGAPTFTAAAAAATSDATARARAPLARAAAHAQPIARAAAPLQARRIFAAGAAPYGQAAAAPVQR